MDNVFAKSIDQSVERLEGLLSTQGRVDFVFHSWKPFNNLGHDGLQFPAVAAPQIPRMTLIPVVTTPASLGSYAVSEVSNRVTPTEHKYLREASSTVSDLISRFAGYSLLHIVNFNFNVTEIKRAYSLFDLLMSGLADENPTLERCAGYLEIDLPYAVPRHDGITVSEVGAQIMKSGRITDRDSLHLQTLLTAIRTSVSISIELATEPVNGRLPQAVRQINEGQKFRFDETESWLEKQFPTFDTSSRIKSGAKTTNQEDAVTRLAALIGDALTDKKKVNTTLSSEGDEEMNRQNPLDVLPADIRKEVEALPESEQYSRIQEHLNKLSNMTIQPEDSLGMTAEELNRVDTLTNDAIVTAQGVVTESQAQVLTEGKETELPITDFQKTQAEARTFEGTDADPESLDATGEAVGGTARPHDPVNELNEGQGSTDDSGTPDDVQKVQIVEGDGSDEDTSGKDDGDSEEADSTPCTATTRSGEPCRNKAVEGSDKCAIHNK